MNKPCSRVRPKLYPLSMSWPDFAALKDVRSADCKHVRAPVDEQLAAPVSMLTFGLASEAALHRVATPSASQARQRSTGGYPFGLASGAALHGWLPLRPRKRGNAPRVARLHGVVLGDGAGAVARVITGKRPSVFQGSPPPFRP